MSLPRFATRWVFLKTSNSFKFQDYLLHISESEKLEVIEDIETILSDAEFKKANKIGPQRVQLLLMLKQMAEDPTYMPMEPKAKSSSRKLFEDKNKPEVEVDMEPPNGEDDDPQLKSNDKAVALEEDEMPKKVTDEPSSDGQDKGNDEWGSWDPIPKPNAGKGSPNIDFQVTEDDLLMTGKRKMDDRERALSKRLATTKNLGVPAKWVEWENSQMAPSALLVMDNESNLLEKIQAVADEGKISLVRSEAIFQTKDGVKLICLDEEALRINLSQIESAIEGIKSQKTELVNPKIKLPHTNLPHSCTDPASVKSLLISHNRFLKEDNFEVLRVFRSRRGLMDITLQVEPIVRSAIERNRGYVSLGLTNTNAVDLFDTMYCSICHSVYHFMSRCRSQAKCFWDGQYHQSQFCKNAGDWNNPTAKCATCDKPGHLPLSMACELYVKKLKEVASRVNYQYKYLMR